ncbi:MAG TPA: M64 family metallopeptidase, partial [Ignavibacteriaceae bacterium]|nr:M64 family metallopeptidase [Ignavibacteriaceae bacterium]
LIYSKGFDSYFKEYQTSDQAINGIKKAFHESALIPFPKNKIKFSVEKRNKSNDLNEIYSFIIDPADIYVINDTVDSRGVSVYKEFYSGDPHSKVDVVILGEGYNENEKAKFEKDLKHFTDLFINQDPYKSLKDRFNIYGIFKASMDSGCDNPGAGIYKNTLLSTTYYSLGSERYILTEDNKTMRDVAANVPYDAIYIMVNESRYGGGGIYNLFCTFVSDNQFSDYIFLHEFGHSFSGLADEYYTSDVAYNDFYPEGVEPVEPNITKLLNKDNLKWKELTTQGVEIPTPWEKEEFDKFDLAWQKVRRELNQKIADLQRAHASEVEIQKLKDKYNNLDKEHSDAVDSMLHKSKFWGKVGAFEGAGYSSKGMYRPMIDCIMFSKGAKPFCKVCEESIKKVIRRYID